MKNEPTSDSEVAPIPNAIETNLRSGKRVCLRPLRPDDDQRIQQGIAELSDRSRYLRFFSGFKEVPPSVVERLADIDGSDHIAWGMVDLDEHNARGFAAAHAIRDDSDENSGEFAIAVLDDYHGQGVARSLMTAIFHNCIVEHMETLTVEILNENFKAKKLLRSVGAKMVDIEGGITTHELPVEMALKMLQKNSQGRPVRCIFDAFATLMVDTRKE